MRSPSETPDFAANSGRSRPTFSRKLLAVRQLARIEKPIGATAYAFLGGYLAAPLEMLWSLPVVTAAFVVFCVTTFGFIINDYCDVVVDGIGKPDRPIPSGRITRRTAGRMAWGVAAIGLVASTTLGLAAALVAFAAVVMSAAYSFRLKSTLLLGNATVAALVATVLLFGAMVAGDPMAPQVLVAACIAVPYILAQEALFNLEDIDDDGDAGLSTTATRLGRARTSVLVRLTLIAFMVAAVSVRWLVPASNLYLLAVSACVVLPTAILVFYLRSPTPQPAVARAVKLSRLVWVTSFLPLALLK